MIKGSFNLPPSSKLPNGDVAVPYVMLGADTFGLSDNLIKPYSGYYLKGSAERVFNYRLSPARRVVENAFGILFGFSCVTKTPAPQT